MKTLIRDLMRYSNNNNYINFTDLEYEEMLLDMLTEHAPGVLRRAPITLKLKVILVLIKSLFIKR